MKLFDIDIVKCGCGLPMRQKDWSEHWRTCKVGSSVPVTEQDCEDLLFYEEKKRKRNEEHKTWLEKRLRKV